MINVYFRLTTTPKIERARLREWIKEHLDFDYRDGLGIRFSVQRHILEKCMIETINPSRFHGIIFHFDDEEDAILFKLTWGEWCLNDDMVKRLFPEVVTL